MPTVQSAEKTRQARWGAPVLIVLVVSTVLAVIALTVVYAVLSASESIGSEPVGESATANLESGL